MLATLLTARRTSIAANVRAWLGAGSVLARIALQERLVYRFNLVISLFATIMTVLVFRHLWISLYGARATYAGVSLDQTITYSAFSIILMQLFPGHMVWMIGRRIRTGDVIFDIIWPMYLGDQLFFRTFGTTVAILLTNSLPTLAIVTLLLGLKLPALGWTWLVFVLSMLLGFMTAFLLDLITGLIGFWTTETTGLFHTKGVLVSILGGRYVPLWVFPPALGQVVLLLPFRGVGYTPLAIFVGAIAPADVPAALGLQCVWIVILGAASRLLYAAAVRKLSIQGG